MGHLGWHPNAPTAICTTLNEWPRPLTPDSLTFGKHIHSRYSHISAHNFSFSRRRISAEVALCLVRTLGIETSDVALILDDPFW
jgi:hypothetical protein